jgi:hypothetical protein
VATAWIAGDVGLLALNTPNSQSVRRRRRRSSSSKLMSKQHERKHCEQRDRRCEEGTGTLLGLFRHLHTDIYGNPGGLKNQKAFIAKYCDKVR